MAANRITMQDMRSGTALMTKHFGQNPLRQLWQDQVIALEEDLNGEERNMPDVVDARVGSGTFKDYKGDKSQLLKKRMRFAERAVFSSEGLQDIDLVALARELYADLWAATPVLTGYLRQHLFYVVGSDVLRVVRPGIDASIIGVINIAPYAAKHDMPGWSRPFHRVLRKWMQRARRENFDVRYRFLQGESVPQRLRREGRTAQYASPVIEIGYLNSMRGRTGNQQIRQRGRRRRRRV